MRTLLSVALAVATCGAQAPPKHAGDSPQGLGRKMLELVNRDRAEAKLPPLAWHDGLAAVAQAHCEDMKSHGFFAHESPRTGKVKDRVAKARIANRGVGENIARARSVEAAERNLMASPKHKANILHKGFTHAGIALLLGDDGWFYCTQVFMTAPPVYDVAAVHRDVVQQINKVRLAKGLRRLVVDDELARQALAHSQRAARLGRFDPLWLESVLRRSRARWRVHAAAYYLTEKLAEVAHCDVAQSPSFDHMGLGVVQSPADSKQAGALWITLICARKK